MDSRRSAAGFGLPKVTHWCSHGDASREWAEGREGVGEVLVVLVETTIATKPSEGSLFIAHGARGHRSATSGEPARAGLIATRS